MELNQENKKGRPKGSGNCSRLKWKVIMYDKNTNEFREGKYCSVNKINEGRDKVDMNKRNGVNSFLERWGHIQISKINEIV
jgi:hypothetical protein